MSEKMKNDRDLIVIFSKIYLFIRRYFIILLLFIITGIAYGCYKNHTAGYFFRKHLVVSSIVVEKYISTDIINSLQTLVADNNIKALAQKLNIPENAAASVMKIDTSTYHYRDNVGFMIDLSVYDSAYSDTITSGLLYFLNNNEYYRKNMQLFVEERQKLLNVLNHKQRSADTTSNGSKSLPQTSGGDMDIFSGYSSSEQIRWMDQKFRLQKDIEFGSKISVVDQSMIRVFAGIGLTKSLILYGIGIGLLGLILSLFIESLRLTRKYLKEQKK
jgi:hypothetical protein